MADTLEKKKQQGGDGSTLQTVLEKKAEKIGYEVLEEEKLPGSRVRFKLKVDDASFESRLEETIRDFGRQVSVPGFRPGKAPKNLVRKSYEGPAREETVKRMVPRLAELYAADKQIEALSQPYLLTFKSEAGTGTVVELALEVHPEIVISDDTLRDLNVEVHKIRVDEHYLDRAIENLRTQNATYEPTDEAYQPKDGMLFNCTVKDADGHVIVERTTHDYYSTKLEEELPGEVAVALVGKKKGDELHLDIEELNEDLGRTEKVHYDVEVLEVKRRQLPTLDDDFAKDVSENFSSLEDLRKNLMESGSKREEEREREEALGEVYRLLRERLEFDLPRAMVENTAQRSVGDMERRLNQYGMSLRNMDQAIVQNYAASMHEQARVNVKNYLLMRAIGKAWNIQPSDEQINEAIEKIATQMGRKPLAVRAQLEAKKQWGQFVEDLTLKLTNDQVLAKATISHKEVSVEEFEEIQRTRQAEQAARLQGLQNFQDHSHSHDHDHGHSHDHSHDDDHGHSH